MDKNTQDPFFFYQKFCRSLCATLKKKVSQPCSPSDLHMYLSLRIWSNSGGELTQVPVPFFLCCHR